MKQTTNKAGYFRRFETFIIDRMDPPSAVDRDTLLYWRARILFAILFVGLLLGILVFIPVTALVIKEGLWGLGIIDGAAWVILLGAFFYAA
ncbi:MAG: hypothetical protein JRF51_18270 [Deltaproteobacteria bacterium]|nr:hypothetical protein [Deltaproteobacteria bacterium]